MIQRSESCVNKITHHNKKHMVYFSKNVKGCHLYKCLSCLILSVQCLLVLTDSVSMRTTLSSRVKTAASKSASVPSFPVMPWRYLSLCFCPSVLFSTLLTQRSCSKIPGMCWCLTASSKIRREIQLRSEWGKEAEYVVRNVCVCALFLFSFTFSFSLFPINPASLHCLITWSISFIFSLTQQTPDLLPVGVCSTIQAEPRARAVKVRPGVPHHCCLSTTRGAVVSETGLLQVWRGGGRGTQLLHCAPSGTRYYELQEKLRLHNPKVWGYDITRDRFERSRNKLLSFDNKNIYLAILE